MGGRRSRQVGLLEVHTSPAFAAGAIPAAERFRPIVCLAATPPIRVASSVRRVQCPPCT